MNAMKPHIKFTIQSHTHTHTLHLLHTKPVKVKQLQTVWLYRACPLSTHTDTVTSTGKTTHVHTEPAVVSDKAYK